MYNPASPRLGSTLRFSHTAQDPDALNRLLGGEASYHIGLAAPTPSYRLGTPKHMINTADVD
jgi:hypothetical protein